MAQRNDDCTPNACCGRSKDGHRIVSVNVIRQLLFEYVHGLIPSDSLQLCDGGLLDKIVSKGFITLEDMKIVCTLHSTLASLSHSIDLCETYDSKLNSQSNMKSKTTVPSSYSELLDAANKSTEKISLQLEHAEEISKRLSNSPHLQEFMARSEELLPFTHFCCKGHSGNMPICSSHVAASRLHIAEQRALKKKKKTIAWKPQEYCSPSNTINRYPYFLSEAKRNRERTSTSTLSIDVSMCHGSDGIKSPDATTSKASENIGGWKRKSRVSLPNTSNRHRENRA